MADRRWVDVSVVGSYFESLSDPGHTRNHRHLLLDVIVIAVCGIISNCDMLIDPPEAPLPVVELADADADPAQQAAVRHLGLVAPVTDEVDDLVARFMGNPATAIKALFVVLTFAGWSSRWGAIAADTGASLLVVFNGLRLLRSRDRANNLIGFSRFSVASYWFNSFFDE